MNRYNRYCILFVFLSTKSLLVAAQNDGINKQRPHYASCSILKKSSSLWQKNNPAPFIMTDQRSVPVGIEHLTSDQPLLRYYSKQIQRITSLELLPSIPMKALSRFRNLNAGGKGNKKLFRATMQGEKDVFIKVLNPKKRTVTLMLNEARHALLLNKLSQRPVFYGLLEFENGDFAFVYENIDGLAFPLHSKIQQSENFRIQESHIASILHLGNLLSRLGFEYTPDMQFILSPDGAAYLIDMEFFFLRKPAQPPLEMPFNPIENTRRLARELTALKNSKMHQRETAPKSQNIIIPGQGPIPKFRPIITK